MGKFNAKVLKKIAKFYRMKVRKFINRKQGSLDGKEVNWREQRKVDRKQENLMEVRKLKTA